MSPSALELQWLWTKFKEGDRLAFSRLYQLYAAELCRYGSRLVPDKEQVRDAVQDLFVNLWNSRQNLGDIQSVRSYLYASLRREVLKHYKQQFISDGELEHWEAAITSSPEYPLTESQQLGVIRHKLQLEIEKLPVRQREAIFLRFYSELEFSEIAAIMEISVRAVYKLMYKAIDTLQKNLPVTLPLLLSLLLFALLLH